MNPNKSQSRQPSAPAVDTEFPDQIDLVIHFSFSNQDMEKVKKWHETTKEELGKKFLADFPMERMVYEAFAGGAVNPDVISIKKVGDADA